jgi:hypothetical protein
VKHPPCPGSSVLHLSHSFSQIAHRRLVTQHYRARLTTSPQAFRALEPSLRSPYLYTTLTSLPLGLATYRTPARLWLIGLQRKLRIPLFPASLRCRCGDTIDIHGDRLFCCFRSSKTNLHNRVRDSWYLMLSHSAPLVQLASRCRLRILSPSPTISKHSPGRRHNPTSPWTLFQPVSHLRFHAYPFTPFFSTLLLLLCL